MRFHCTTEILRENELEMREDAARRLAKKKPHHPSEREHGIAEGVAA